MKEIFYYLQMLFLLLTATCCTNDNAMDLIKQEGLITKAEIDINQDTGKEKIITTDLKELEKINQALRKAQKINIQKGGAFDLLSNITIYKNGQKASFDVLHSVDHGWYIETDNFMLYSDFIFKLIDNYNRKNLRH